MFKGNCFEIEYKKKFPFVCISKKNLFSIFFLALLVGFLAFFYETLLDYIIVGYLFDRGFLIGPFIPIYFFCIFIGLCYIKVPSLSFKNVILSILVIGSGITLIEFIVGNVFELLVGQELWTYDNFMPLSYKYVSLSVALIWGLLGTFIVMFVFPLLKKIIDKIPDKIHLPIVISFLVIFILDIIISFALVIKNGKYQELYMFKRSSELSLFIIGIFLFIIVAILFAIFLYKSLWKFKKTFVILFFISLSFLFVSCRDFLHKSDNKFISILSSCGFIIAAFYIYFLISIIIISLIRIIIYVTSKNQKVKSVKCKSFSLLLSLIISIITIICGMYSLENYKITSFCVGNGDNSLNIIALSDIHYGSTGTNIDLSKMVDRINKENPDVCFLLGDVFDNTLESIDVNYLKNNLNNIEAKYGVYAISGNHEYEYNTYKAVKDFYKDTNVTFLVDNSVIINDAIQVIGRLDLIYSNRSTLSSLIKDNSLPTIVLDHQPQNYEDSVSLNVALQLSGHTHNGQLWPGNLLVNLYYKFYYHNTKTNGMFKIKNTTLYVTSGYGAWGFPLKTVGRSEMLKIEFRY